MPRHCSGQLIYVSSPPTRPVPPLFLSSAGLYDIVIISQQPLCPFPTTKRCSRPVEGDLTSGCCGNRSFQRPPGTVPDKMVLDMPPCTMIFPLFSYYSRLFSDGVDFFITHPGVVYVFPFLLEISFACGRNIIKFYCLSNCIDSHHYEESV